jgi:hypothetical protein
MELSYILQACVTAVMAAVTGGALAWATLGLASKVHSDPTQSGGPLHVFRGFHHAAR